MSGLNSLVLEAVLKLNKYLYVELSPSCLDYSKRFLGNSSKRCGKTLMKQKRD